MRVILVLGWSSLVLAPAHGQSRRNWITESTVTFGRGGAFVSNSSFLAGAVGLADVGLRWSSPSGRSLGFSVAAGRDFPNEASLVGVRARAAREWGSNRLEASLGLFGSSAGVGGIGHSAGLGGIVGLAYYPARWGALIGQLDLLPTFPDSAGLAQTPVPPTRKPAASVGVRVAGRAGMVPWLGSGLVALLWLVFKD
jgi:hypothetical protein